MCGFAHTPPMRLDGRVCLVTGGSAGIGKETARGLAALGGRVVLTGRSTEKSEAAAADIRASTGNPHVSGVAADLASFDAVEGLADHVRSAHGQLHVLVNNAGLWLPTRKTTALGHEQTFAVNHLAHFLLTTRLLDLLVASAPARVITVSSRLHERETAFDFDDPMGERRYAGMRAYRQSKLANVMFASELARRTAGTGVTSNSLHPGDVATEVTRENRFLQLAMDTVARWFLKSAAQGAEGSIQLASDPALADVTGKYFRDQRAVAPSPAALDAAACARLWALSESLVPAR
jgi:NAD(P)-dependent dehydrogenase (short-subunit alcohol dehydrogenase family)